MENIPPCPSCKSPYAYEVDKKLVCPECGFEWEVASEENTQRLKVKDINGNLLKEGDSIIISKDLPVKGAPKPIKAGTKVKSVRLVDGDHNIDCKVPGFGPMALKSEFVKKA